MSFALFGLLSVILCWKWGNWRNWKEYYPTILYFLIGNLIYDVLTQMKPLWYFGETFGQYPVFEIIVIVLLYPSTTILFLTYYPADPSIKKQASYLLLWVLIYSVTEYVAYITEGFSYDNGWNFYYSVLFNILMFPLLRLHHKKPLLVWPVSAILAFIVIIWFKIPLMKQ